MVRGLNLPQFASTISGPLPGAPYYNVGVHCGSPAVGPLLNFTRVCTLAGPRSGQPLGWRREIRDRIAELESRRLRLEEARVRASDEGTDEGDRLEAELRAELQQISEQINDLRASLE
jgi:hypothetical protein